MVDEERFGTGRLPGESSKAFAAFRIYAEMGPQRSLMAVAKTIRKDHNYIAEWSRKFHWQERLVTWDSEQVERVEAAKAQAELELAREKAKRREQIQESAWAMFVSLRDRAKLMLNAPVFTRDVNEKRTKKGKTEIIEKTTVIAPQFRNTDLAKLVEVADALGRLSCGMPSKVHGLSDPDGLPFAMPNVAAAAAPTTVIVNITRNAESDRAAELFDEPATDGA